MPGAKSSGADPSFFCPRYSPVISMYSSGESDEPFPLAGQLSVSLSRSQMECGQATVIFSVDVRSL